MQRIVIWLYRALGVGLAIGIMEVLARFGHHEAAQVPFVTSIVLTLTAPDSAPAQPHAVVLGHLLSASAGMVALSCFGPGDTAAVVGVGLAALLMLTCRSLHPPAGIDAFLVAQLSLPWSWVVNPVLIGALMLAAFSWLWAAGGRRLFSADSVGATAKQPQEAEPLA